MRILVVTRYFIVTNVVISYNYLMIIYINFIDLLYI